MYFSVVKSLQCLVQSTEIKHTALFCTKVYNDTATEIGTIDERDFFRLSLTPCGLATSCGFRNLGQHWPM